MGSYIRALLAWRLMRQQARLLKRIKLAKAKEAECFAAAIIQTSPIAESIQAFLVRREQISLADSYRRQRRKDVQAFLVLQKEVERLLA